MLKHHNSRAGVRRATTAELRGLCVTIVGLKTVPSLVKFLTDLCTPAELAAMTERWAVAQQVADGAPYRAVSASTGASTATVTRVAQWLRFGAGGYRLALRRMRKGSST